jgi:hypothetical protein
MTNLKFDDKKTHASSMKRLKYTFILIKYSLTCKYLMMTTNMMTRLLNTLVYHLVVILQLIHNIFSLLKKYHDDKI